MYTIIYKIEIQENSIINYHLFSIEKENQIKSPKKDCVKNFQRSSSTSVNNPRTRVVIVKSRGGGGGGKFSLQEVQTIDVSCEKLKLFFFFLRHLRLVLRIPISRIKYNQKGNIFSSSKTETFAPKRARGNGRALDIDPSRAFLERSFNRNAFFLSRDPYYTYPPLSLAS